MGGDWIIKCIFNSKVDPVRLSLSYVQVVVLASLAQSLVFVELAHCTHTIQIERYGIKHMYSICQ